MKNRLALLIGIIVVGVLLVYMFAFQVRYDEVAVLTTFDKATRPEVGADGKLVRNNEDYLASPGSVIDRPGLYFKWPWPIQSVHPFSKQLQILDDVPEEQPTADGYNVIVRTYLVWKIEDPYSFFVSLQTIDRAERQLQPLLREIRSVLGKYRFDQLVNTDPNQLQLAKIEDEALTLIRARLAQIQLQNAAGAPSGYGISVEHLGIRRIVLPERVTESVFARMRANRERLAQSARSAGDAEAASIRSEANNAQRTILSFAQRRAESIRAQGVQQAAVAYKVFEQDQGFAVFLAQIETLKTVLKKNTQLILDAHGPFELFKNEPGGPAPAGGK